MELFMFSAGVKKSFLVRFWVWSILGVFCCQTTVSARQLVAPEAVRPTLGLATVFPASPGIAEAPAPPFGSHPRGLQLHQLSESSSGRQAELKKRPRTGLYLSAGLAVSAGVLALWSRREADRAYDRYLHAAGQTRQKKQFNQAESYDRISGAALAAMEVGIVLTTYLVFF